MSPREFRAKHVAKRCDECWRGFDNTVLDDDAAALPEAKWLSEAYRLELSA